MLSHIRIVLVKTFHSGNIGSTARAMKTMGLSDLCLVNPVDFISIAGQEEALKMAMSANDVIKNITLVDNLSDAIKDCMVVIASTARCRGYDLPELTPEESAKLLYTTAQQSAQESNVALVFGPERMGLSNEDLQRCNYRVTIPTSPDYSSLNLAAAVQTLSYEIFKQYKYLKDKPEENSIRTLPRSKALENLYNHFESTLNDTGFIVKNHPGEIMQKLRNIFTRAELDESEVNILRGILSSVDREIKK
ncbi:MAG: RNA methyltransferase [Cocleimonas sp.]|nr:RNA methyltransferase [Cocleimonas sp.]